MKTNCEENNEKNPTVVYATEHGDTTGEIRYNLQQSYWKEDNTVHV